MAGCPLRPLAVEASGSGSTAMVGCPLVRPLLALPAKGRHPSAAAMPPRLASPTKAWCSTRDVKDFSKFRGYAPFSSFLDGDAVNGAATGAWGRTR
jgi:hypothetical protein